VHTFTGGTPSSTPSRVEAIADGEVEQPTDIDIPDEFGHLPSSPLMDSLLLDQILSDGRVVNLESKAVTVGHAVSHDATRMIYKLDLISCDCQGAWDPDILEQLKSSESTEAKGKRMMDLPDFHKALRYWS
jgi:hypothetical protein